MEDENRAPAVTLAAMLLVFAVWQATTILLGPNLSLNHDEANFVIEGLRLPAQARLTSYVHTPLVYELMAVAEVAWYAIGRILGSVGSPVDHLANILAVPGPHLKLGRLLTLVAALLCLLQVYRVARIFAGRWGAVGATLLCAGSATFAVFSTTIKEEVYFWLFLLTAMDLIWRTAPGARRRPFLAGVAVGAAFAAKYMGVFGMVLALIPVVRYGRESRREGLRQAVWMAGGAALGVLVLFPFLLLDTAAVLGSIRQMSDTTASLGPDLTLGPYLLTHLPRLVGLPVAAAAAAELVIRLRKEPRGPVLLLTPIAILLVFMATRRGHSMGYYIFPVALAGFILAAAFAVRIAKLLRGPWRLLPPVALAALFFLDPAYVSSAAKYSMLMTAPDTRELAGAQIASRVPDGACVAANGGVVGWNQFGPALAPAQAQAKSASASGTYAAGEKAAIERRPRPRYRLELAEKFNTPTEIPADCRWLVLARIGAYSFLEVPILATEPPPAPPPADFQPVAEVKAFPEMHSRAYPYPTVLDLDELRAIPLSQMWRERRRGPSFTIYRRTTPSQTEGVNR